MVRLYDVRCEGCGAVREEMLDAPPTHGTTLDCPSCGAATRHARHWSLQSVYTWRDPDSPSQRGKPTCKIGEH